METKEIEKLRAELEKTKIRERDLKLKADELTDFIENASLPLHWVDGEGTIIWANKAELDSLGYTREEYVGKHINEFHEDRSVIDDILTKLVGKQTLLNYPAKLKAKDGSIKHVLINSNVLWDGDNFVHTRCFTRDITEIKKEEEKREALLKKLEEKNAQLKASFEDVETKVKFRTLELERKIGELLEENAKLKQSKIESNCYIRI